MAGVTDLGPTQLKNIRKADPGLLAASWRPGAGEAGETGGTRLAAAPTPPEGAGCGLAPLAAALAALLVVGAVGAWWFLDANRPASVATKTPAEAARLSMVVLPLRQSVGRSGQDYLVNALTMN